MENAKVKSLVDYRIKPPNQTIQPGVNTPPPSVAPKPRLLDQVRQAIRTRHYSYRTEKAYIHLDQTLYLFSQQTAPN